MGETTKASTMLVLGDSESALQIPVDVKKITSRGEVSLDSASPAGNVLKQVQIDTVTEGVVPSEEIRKGIFRSKPKKSDKETWGDFAPISKEDLDAIEQATSLDTFQIEHFVPLKDVPLERVTEAYYLAPAKGVSAKPLVLLARALRKTKRAGVFKMVKSSRQYLAVVYEKDGGLIVNVLAFANDFASVREAAEALERVPVKISSGELSMAVAAVEAWGSEADVLDGYEDELLPLKADLVERALAGKLPKREAEPETAQVEQADDDLEERLRASLKNQRVKQASVTPKAPVAA